MLDVDEKVNLRLLFDRLIYIMIMRVSQSITDKEMARHGSWYS